MKEVAQYIITKMVDNPDNVEVNEVEENRTVKLSVKVHPDDMGKLIGKKGQNIGALRTVLKAICSKEEKKNFVLDIIED